MPETFHEPAKKLFILGTIHQSQDTPLSGYFKLMLLSFVADNGIKAILEERGPDPKKASVACLWTACQTSYRGP